MNVKAGFKLTIGGRTLRVTAEQIAHGPSGMAVVTPEGRKVYMSYEELPAIAKSMGWELQSMAD